jgi:hypothetical protein
MLRSWVLVGIGGRGLCGANINKYSGMLYLSLATKRINIDRSALCDVPFHSVPSNSACLFFVSEFYLIFRLHVFC